MHTSWRGAPVDQAYNEFKYIGFQTARGLTLPPIDKGHHNARPLRASLAGKGMARVESSLFAEREGVRFNLISMPLFLHVERAFQAVAGGKVIILVLHFCVTRDAKRWKNKKGTIEETDNAGYLRIGGVVKP